MNTSTYQHRVPHLRRYLSAQVSKHILQHTITARKPSLQVRKKIEAQHQAIELMCLVALLCMVPCLVLVLYAPLAPVPFLGMSIFSVLFLVSRAVCGFRLDPVFH